MRKFFKFTVAYSLFALFPEYSLAEIRLYKDIVAGVSFEEFSTRQGYADCSVSGVIALCQNNQKFLGVEGEIAVIFDGGISSRVIFHTLNASLFQNARMHFFGDDYAIVGMETPKGMLDLVYEFNTNGESATLSKITQAELEGSTIGSIKYIFIEGDQSELMERSTLIEAVSSVPSGNRLISVSMQKGESGTAEVTVAFELNPVDMESMQDDVREKIREDF